MNQVKAFQEYYPEELSYCYGCGVLNEHGLKIKSYWDSDDQQSVCIFEPKPYHIAVPGFVYGGLIASLIDCHCTGTASAMAQRFRSIPPDGPHLRFVTASLHVDYLKPTPLGVPLEVRAAVKEMKGRKIVMTASLSAQGIECARGEVVAVQIPDDFLTTNS